MTAMTPIKKIVRTHLNVYYVDYANEATLMCTSETPSKASEIAYALAGWHKVSLEETDGFEVYGGE